MKSYAAAICRTFAEHKDTPEVFAIQFRLAADALDDQTEAIAKAIAAERSECAKMIEAKWQEARDTEFDLGFETARQCFAAAIRARGQT